MLLTKEDIEKIEGNWDNEPLKINKVFFDEPILEDENEAVKFLIEEFRFLDKNITSKNDARLHWCYKGRKFPIQSYDVQRAYDLAYGDGAEFEWDCA